MYTSSTRLYFSISRRFLAASPPQKSIGNERCLYRCRFLHFQVTVFLSPPFPVLYLRERLRPLGRRKNRKSEPAARIERLLLVGVLFNLSNMAISRRGRGGPLLPPAGAATASEPNFRFPHGASWKRRRLILRYQEMNLWKTAWTCGGKTIIDL